MMKVSAQKNEDGKSDTAIREGENAGDLGIAIKPLGIKKFPTISNSCIADKPSHNWKLRSGKNKFFCRIVTSKHCSIFLLTIFLISSTTALFCVFE